MAEQTILDTFSDAKNPFTIKVDDSKINIYTNKSLIAANNLIDPINPSGYHEFPKALFATNNIFRKSKREGFTSSLVTAVQNTDQWIFTIPSSAGAISRLLIKFTLTAPTSYGYCRYPAISVIKKIVIKHGNNILHEIDNYAEVNKTILSTKSTEDQQRILTDAGGIVAVTTAVTCCSEIPSFWSPFIHHHGENLYVRPFVFPARCDTPLTIEVTPQAGAYWYDATSGAGVGGTVSSVDLYYEQLTANAMQLAAHRVAVKGQNYKSIDWVSAKAYTSLTTGTETLIQTTGLNGIIKNFHIIDHLATEVSTSRNLLDTDSVLSTLYMKINQADYEKELGSSYTTIKRRDYMQGGVTATPYVTSTQLVMEPTHIISFSQTGVGKDMNVYFGGISNNTDNTIDIYAAQASGSTHSALPVAVRHAEYYIGTENLWKRRL